VGYRGREDKNICIIPRGTKVEVIGRQHVLMTLPPVKYKFVTWIILSSCRAPWYIYMSASHVMINFKLYGIVSMLGGHCDTTAWRVLSLRIE
jgi:hypothetical protein